MKQFLFLLVLLFTTTVYTQQYVQKQESQIINMLSNPGYESGKTSWGTNFTNSLTVVSGTQALFGSASLKFGPQSSVFTEVYSPLLTVPQGLQGQQCNAIVNYRTNESVNYFVAKVKDASGTELITDVLLPKIIMGVPTEGANSLTLAFECPTNNQIELEISQTISGGYITLDGMHLGSKTGGLGTAEDIIGALGYTPADQVDLLAVSSTATTALNTALSVSATVNTLSGTVLYKANNLSDIASATVARTNLGLGTVATENIVPVSKGGTSLTTTVSNGLLVGSGTALYTTLSPTSSGALTTLDANGNVAWLQPEQDDAGFNYLPNGTFEQGIQNWAVSGTESVAMFTSNYPSTSKGNASYAVLNTNSLSSARCNTFPIVQDGNTDVELNIDYSAFQGVSATVSVWDGSTNKLSQALDYTNTDNSITMRTYKAYFSVASSTTTLKACMSSAGGSIPFDNVYVGKLRSMVNGAIVEACTNYTPAITGFGSITLLTAQYCRHGDSYFIRGRFVAGTIQAAPAVIPLPNSMVISSGVSSTQSVGLTVVGNRQDRLTSLITGGQTYVTVGYNTTSLSPTNVSNYMVNGEVVSFEAGPIPIQGLQGSGVSYDGRCPNDISCENTFSAKISSSGVVSDESLDFLSGCTNPSTGNYTCTFNSGIFTVAPNCTATSNGNGVSNNTVRIQSITTTTIVYNVSLDGTTDTNRPIILSCQKQGVDFVAKKTIQGYLNQTVTTSGQYKERMERVIFAGTTIGTNCTSTPCAIISQSGGTTSVTRSTTGVYKVNFATGVFSAPPTCLVFARASAANVLPVYQTAVQTSTTFDFAIINMSNASADGYADIICIGAG